MKPEIIPDMPNAAYHAHPAVGSSGLKLIGRSPLHYWAAYVDPARVRKEPTPAMKTGTAWHAAIFEPEAFAEDYVEIPEGLDRRTKEGKALWAELEASGKEPLTTEGLAQITAMVAAAKRHPAVRVLFEQNGVAEQSMFWTDAETGVRCKIRPDYAVLPCKLFPHGLVVDGKTTEDASPVDFPRSAWNWEMHTQAAFYVDGFMQVLGTKQPPAFIWLAQEKAAPYATAVYSAAEDLLAYGRKLYAPHLRALAGCQASGTWPGYPTTVAPLVLPAWAERAVQEGAAA